MDQGLYWGFEEQASIGAEHRALPLAVKGHA
jgi:hypothetical protein